VVIGGRVSRRVVVAGTVAGAAAIGTLLHGSVADRRQPSAGAVGGQAGIVTPPLGYLSIAAFDLLGDSRADLARVLRGWGHATVELFADRGGRVTVTVGLGPALFADQRLGIGGSRPEALRALPAFPGDALDPAGSDGDLCVQVCADSPAAALEATRDLIAVSRPWAALRWRQCGFRAVDGRPDPPGLFGFRDGTVNLDIHDPADTERFLWVADGPKWMHGGTYVVVRRIRLLLDTWDRVDPGVQESVIGRRLLDNAERPASLRSHRSLASPARNGGAKLLRRSYSYDAGADPNGLLDAGLIFLCFQRDPHRQFVPIQQRLAEADPLNAFSQHVASALFACPPVASWVGAELLA
jgi:deferrochelatase/peroxidase EfeB